jgi:hypothetical protein
MDRLEACAPLVAGFATRPAAGHHIDAAVQTVQDAHWPIDGEAADEARARASELGRRLAELKDAEKG